MLIMPSKNPYKFGLTLLVMFISMEELSMSLLFSSSKSDRASLDQAKVSRIIGEIELLLEMDQMKTFKRL